MAKDSKNEFYEALVALSEFSSIPLEDLVNRIEQGVLKAVRKEYSDIEPEDFDVRLINGNLNVYMMRTVVDDEPTYINEININDAVKVDPNCVLGEKVAFPLDPNKFKRVAVSYAKQSIHHDVREYEKEKLLEEYRDRLEHALCYVTTEEIQNYQPDVEYFSYTTKDQKYQFSLAQSSMRVRASEETAGYESYASLMNLAPIAEGVAFKLR